MQVPRVLAAALAFALPIAAQTVAAPAAPVSPSGKTETLWRMETSGLGGWGAAAQAQRAGRVLAKEKGLKNLIFDSTGIGYFEVVKDFTPTASALNELLVKNRVKDVKVTKLKQVEMAKPEAAYEIAIAGLGWMGSAVAAREALAGIPGVIRAHAFGHNGKALIFVADKKAVTEAKVREALRLAQNEEPLVVRKMEPAKV